MNLFKLLLISIALCSLAGCAMVAAYPMTAASVGTTVATGKSPAEHAVSEGSDKDCSIGKIFDGQPICEERLKPQDVPVKDYSKNKKVVKNQ